RFKAQFPDIEVDISNSTAPLDFGTEQCDIAIVFGDGNWPGAEATLLLEDIIEPVCCPNYLDGHSDDATPAEILAGKTLLVSKYRKNDWAAWLSHVNLTGMLAAAETMSFSSSILTWQAAIDGLGVAIGQQYATDTDVAAGRL